MRKLLLLLSLPFLIIVILYSQVPENSTGIFSKIEKTPPTVVLNPAEASITKGVPLHVVDAGSGIASVKLVLTQGTERQVREIPVEGDGHTLDLLLPLNLPGSQIREGQLGITAIVTDRSFFANKAEAQISLLVDYTKPTLQVLSLQHLVSQGGAESVLFKATDSNLVESGVRVGEFTFPAFPAADADPRLRLKTDLDPDLKIGLFALPLGYKGSALLYATDSAGNTTTIPLYFRIRDQAVAPVMMNLKEQYIRTKVGDLLPGFAMRAPGTVPPQAANDASLSDLVALFRQINLEYRTLLDKHLSELLRKTGTERSWNEVFLKPMPSATSSTFGEQRTYRVGTLDAGFSVHNGLDLASVNNDIVRATNNGTVILAEEFGIYGNTVVIDHGLGLTSLYGHLSSIDCKVGDRIARGAELGRTGQTGLAGGDHLHFEFRVGAIPVNPREWWDGKWITDHLDGKVTAYLEQQ